MKDKKKDTMRLTAFILLIIGFLMFILLYYTSGVIAPGSPPSSTPFSLVLLNFIIIFSGVLLLIWNINLRISRNTKILATVIILCFSIVGLYYIYNEYCVSPEYPSFEFLPDTTNKTITLIEFNHGDFANQLNWDDVVVTMGDATLPTGIINEGDVITNCSGIIKMSVFMPGHTGASFLYSYEFS